MKLKISDLLAFFYIAAITAFLLFATGTFISLTKNYPYPMGFAKFALLATFGECLKYRLGPAKEWIPNKIATRFIIWGLFGMWITFAFAFVEAGATTLFPNEVSPFAKSCFINFAIGYAPTMMFAHYWSDAVVSKGMCWPWTLFGKPESEKWAKVVILSIVLFWLTAHTITFSVAPEWRIIIAAYLSIALGLILSFAAGQRS